ncbi:MAG: symmetrical bis(5'-nucleosyl)-tetraphosphatase [Burkholderiales bacterium]|nr:symmetrical bis(5'-nucleosyl)-tetraphosphatase [Burkholderiales bacterium]
MATYVIGDIQGCFVALTQLLQKIAFDPRHDRLWLVGDLVNRGPQSLEVLRWAKSLGDRVVAVLGNHDLHLLAVAEGFVPLHHKDTLGDVLTAPDRAELLQWLRERPLIHFEHGWLMVHAGLLPQWTVLRAVELAHEVEAELRSPHYRHFLAHMYGNEPRQWRDDLTGIARLRVITNAMTRLRFCTREGVMEFAHKGPPSQPPAGFLPWYEVPERQSRGAPIVFGHWSAHGLDVNSDYCALDTGCLWGGALSAMRLEDRALFQVSCQGLAGTRPLR